MVIIGFDLSPIGVQLIKKNDHESYTQHIPPKVEIKLSGAYLGEVICKHVPNLRPINKPPIFVKFCKNLQNCIWLGIWLWKISSVHGAGESSIFPWLASMEMNGQRPPRPLPHKKNSFLVRRHLWQAPTLANRLIRIFTLPFVEEYPRFLRLCSPIPIFGIIMIVAAYSYTLSWVH